MGLPFTPNHFTLVGQNHRALTEFPVLYHRFMLAILHIVLYIWQPQSLNYPITTSPPTWCPHICSLHLHLYICPANRFICTIFSRFHMYVLIFNIFSLSVFTLFDRLYVHLSLFSSVQFSCSVVSDCLQPYEIQHTRPPCLSLTLGDYPNSCPLSR